MESVWIFVPFKFVCSVAGPTTSHTISNTRARIHMHTRRLHLAMSSSGYRRTTNVCVRRRECVRWFWWANDTRVHLKIISRTWRRWIGFRAFYFIVKFVSTLSCVAYAHAGVRTQRCTSSTLTHAHERCLASFRRRHRRRRWIHWMGSWASFVVPVCAVFWTTWRMAWRSAERSRTEWIDAAHWIYFHSICISIAAFASGFFWFAFVAG